MLKRRIFTCFTPNTRTIENEASFVIPSDVLVEVFRFLNRKDISKTALTNRRCRDISRKHFTQYPLLMLHSLETTNDTKPRKKKLGFEIRRNCAFVANAQDILHFDQVCVTLNSSLLSNPAPAYLRFKKVFIKTRYLFQKYPQKLNSAVRKFLKILKRLQSAFVGCKLYFDSGRALGEPFTTRRSLLHFLKVEILPLFPSCTTYELRGLNLQIREENEMEQESLLLLPQLCDTKGTIELNFCFMELTMTFEPWIVNNSVSPMISVQELISWLHRHNPEKAPKILKLCGETFSYDLSRTVDVLKEIKHRLLEIFASATQIRSYCLEVFRDQFIEIRKDRFEEFSEFDEDFIAVNNNTGEQLKIFYTDRKTIESKKLQHIGYSDPFLTFERTH